MKRISDILGRIASRIGRSRAAKIFVSTMILIMSSTSKLMAKPVMLFAAMVSSSVSVAALLEMYGCISTSALLWSVPTLLLSIIDAKTGIKAAKYRKEKITLSRFLRDTLNKLLSYFCWIFTVFSVGYLTGYDKVGIYGMLFSLLIECSSIIENHLETKGLGISWAGVWNAIKSAINSKTGIDLGDGSLLTTRGGRGCGEMPDDNDNGTITK